jgi:Domain of unknown function (DUF4123)
VNGDALLAAIGQLPLERFAVVDGALFDDLPAALAAIGLRGKPLYLGGADIDSVRGGPYLVRLGSWQDAQALIGLIGDKATGVFWSSPTGEDALFAHLRRLNIVKIARVHEPAGPDDFTPVLFRHADPDVIGIMTAVMTPGQQQEFLGETPAIAWSSRKCGGVGGLGPAWAGA